MITAHLLASLLVLTIGVQDPPAPAAEAAAPCPHPERPTVLRPERPVRPATPRCINEAARTHTCRPAQIRAHEQEMEAYGAAFDAYVAAINGYAAHLHTYVQGVIEYGNCEHRNVVPSSLIIG